MEADPVTFAVGKQGNGANTTWQLQRAKHALTARRRDRRAWPPDCQYADK
jgi:hypothetical protein